MRDQVADVIRLRKLLTADDPQASWPAGTGLMASAALDPRPLHALLAQAYASGVGTIAVPADWWPAIVADSEYDRDLVFVATGPSGAPIGLALCWISGFIKDLAVHPDWQGRGLGEALLRTTFAAFRRRGLDHVDLKVMAGNAPALALYRRLGMVAVD